MGAGGASGAVVADHPGPNCSMAMAAIIWSLVPMDQ